MSVKIELWQYAERQREESRKLSKLAENARLRANLLAAAADEATALSKIDDLDLSEDFEKIKDRLERRVSVLEPLALGLGMDEKTFGDLRDWLNRHTNHSGPGPTSPTAYVEDTTLCQT